MKLRRLDRGGPGWRPSKDLEAVQDALAAGVGRDDWAVELVWVDDAEIRRLNRDYRGKDAVTDVLSFSDLSEDGPGDPDLAAGEAGAWADLWRDPTSDPDDDVVGQVVVAPDFTVGRCAERGWDPDDEIAMLTIHGLLHVLGWDHEDEDQRRRMADLEEERLRTCGRSHPMRNEGRD